MKFGVLTFSYSGSGTFEAQRQSRGYIDANIGDNMQGLAVRQLYARLGLRPTDVVAVDRDTLSTYDGPPVMLVMNACFMRRSFPIPEQIIPIFVGFQAKEPVIVRNLDYFRRHQPIGCRDPATAAVFRRHGIAAHVTGCLTLTFAPRSAPPPQSKVLIVYGALAGGFPAEALAQMPQHLARTAEFVYQRKIIHRFPLTPKDLAQAERHAAGLLDDYRARATLVITSLHHAAAPCIASGIPVILCRQAADTRFGFLETLLPIHIAPEFAGIDWNPQPVDIEPVRLRLTDQVRAGLIAALHRHEPQDIGAIQRLSSPGTGLT